MRMLATVMSLVFFSAVASVAATDAPMSPATGGLPPPKGPNVLAEAKPLLLELNNPKYAASRCMLSPVLAANGRVVAMSADPAFKQGDTFVAVDADPVDPSTRSGLLDLLEHRQPGATLQLRMLRGGAEISMSAVCTDVKPYYAALREGARAAVDNQVGSCADKLDAAARLHALSSIWLRLSMSCRIVAGRLTGDAIWHADYKLFRQRILETQYTPAMLNQFRRGILNAERDLRTNGNAPLADALRAQYAAAVASGPADD